MSTPRDDELDAKVARIAEGLDAMLSGIVEGGCLWPSEPAESDEEEEK